MGYGAAMLEHTGYPMIYNIEEDPREERPILEEGGWAVGPYLKVIGEYKASLKKHPNPPAFNLTDFRD